MAESQRSSSNDKEREKALFLLIASALSTTPAGNIIERTFAVLCKQKLSHVLIGQIKGFMMRNSLTQKQTSMSI